MRRFLQAIAIAAVGLGSSYALAQTTGDIVGHVTDETGGVLPGVTVEARGPAFQGVRSNVTDAAGAYRLVLLPPGTYKVTATLQGFATTEATRRRRPRQDVDGRPPPAPDGERRGRRHGRVAPDRPDAGRRSGTTSTAGRSSPCRPAAATPRSSRSRRASRRRRPTRPPSRTRSWSTARRASRTASSSTASSRTASSTAPRARTSTTSSSRKSRSRPAATRPSSAARRAASSTSSRSPGGNEFHGEAFAYYDNDSLQASNKHPEDSQLFSFISGYNRLDYGFDLGGFVLKDKHLVLRRLRPRAEHDQADADRGPQRRTTPPTPTRPATSARPS